MNRTDEEKKKILEDLHKIMDSTVVKVDDEGSDTLGKDLQEIVKELRHDDNIFRFTNQKREKVGYFSMLGAIGEIPNYKENVKPRYAFVNSFLKHFAINSSAIKSEQADRFESIASSLLNFRGMLEYRSAGVRPGMMDNNPDIKHGIMDRLKK